MSGTESGPSSANRAAESVSAGSSSGPRAAAALSTATDLGVAVSEVVEQALARLGARPDLAICFASPSLLETMLVANAPVEIVPIAAGDPASGDGASFAGGASLGALLHDALGAPTLIGCSGESILGMGREIEDRPALALWVASLPGAMVEPVRLEFVRSAEGGAFVGWPPALAGDWPAGGSLLLLGEPYSFPADALLERLAEDRPGTLVAGGVASGGHAPGQNRLWLGRREWNTGAVGVWIGGGVRLRGVVSQGCRPIGRPLIVTRAERNIVQELGGKPALAAFGEIYKSLSPAEQALVGGGLHLGRVVNEYQDTFARGDFLVRNVIGADREAGSIAVGDYMRVGQTVQFHVRDSQTADEDLAELLAAARSELKNPPAGALVFTCNGRGSRLFEQPDHDAQSLARLWPDLPMAGFFAQGEIGPIGGRSFLHGFTASVVLLEAAPGE